MQRYDYTSKLHWWREKKSGLNSPLFVKTRVSISHRNTQNQVWLKLVQWFWRRFGNFWQCIFDNPLLSPLEKGKSHDYLNKVEFPSSKDSLCLILLNQSKSYGEEVLNFCYHLPLKKGMTLHLNKVEFSLPRLIVPILIEISLVAFENKI